MYVRAWGTRCWIGGWGVGGVGAVYDINGMDG